MVEGSMTAQFKLLS